MIKLSMEIPLVHLKDLSPLMDLDFALAQHVLDSVEYSDFYDTQRMHGREVLLDNGLHELDHSLTCGEILEAAKRCNPTYVIAPDFHLDAMRTHLAFEQMVMLNGGRWKLGLVLQGESSEERRDLFFTNIKHISLLCLPFKYPRYSWFEDLIDIAPAKTIWPKRFHLLGVSTLEELQKWTNLVCKLHPELIHKFSVDTAKPVKWGYTKQFLSEDVSLRNHPLPSKDIVSSPAMDSDQMKVTLYNTAFLRKYL